ncbi:hypothetical protein HHK36_013851 [Tetracentron sinense]|uniref:Defective in cullin neddylation protein n=1 Tax=Tetracentron sinense TaxID=13715 RepID=A0A834ZE26_TETSI|nr:hypothetical protein HHK36_013851 [Tetracentron sinense]
MHRPTTTTISAIDLNQSASSESNTKMLEWIDRLFNSYANRSSGMINREGVEALCSDVKVDHTDVRILMLAWKMNARRQGYFTLDEWRTGLIALEADTIKKLRKVLQMLEEVGTSVLRPKKFMDFYSYSFRYCLTEEKHKTIDMKCICELLDLVLGCRFRSQVDSFVEYLKVSGRFMFLIHLSSIEWTAESLHIELLQNPFLLETLPESLFSKLDIELAQNLFLLGTLS